MVPRDRTPRQPRSNGQNSSDKAMPRYGKSPSNWGKPGDKPSHTPARKDGFRGRPGPKEEPPSPKRLAELLKLHGVPQPPAIVDKIWAYHQFIRKHNHDLDLTRLIGFSTIVQRHYADCLILQRYYGKKWPKTMVDIGTGAGFPGMMIKIASPEVHLILSEPRPRRVDFLNAAIQHLGLKDIEVFGHKFTSKSFTRPVDGAITRAFETVDKTLPRLMNALPLGGKAIFMKGPKGEEEAQNTDLPDWKLTRKIAYQIPHTTLDRMLLEYTRVGMSQGSGGQWEDDESEGTGEAED
jgi:16S rRNA (guanine527-N7)-methyltransferase